MIYPLNMVTSKEKCNKWPEGTRVPLQNETWKPDEVWTMVLSNEVSKARLAFHCIRLHHELRHNQFLACLVVLKPLETH
jgi:hypothetical protein